jgi:hypothetical protein
MTGKVSLRLMSVVELDESLSIRLVQWAYAADRNRKVA